MSSEFDIYKMPIGLTEGIIIALPNTKAEFKVILPSSTNEEFQMKLMSALNMHISANDMEDPDNIGIDVNPAKFNASRRKTFFEECILSAEGLPDGMSPKVFFATYPLAAKYVYEQATKLASISDKEVNAALGKSTSTPNGRSSGKVDMISTN